MAILTSRIGSLYNAISLQVRNGSFPLARCLWQNLYQDLLTIFLCLANQETFRTTITGL